MWASTCFILFSPAAASSLPHYTATPAGASIRRTETTTTIPDMGLESHLFMRQLAGEHDVHDREVLHTRIEEWMCKMFEWHGPGVDWVIETDPLIAPHCKQLVLLLEERDRLGVELKETQKDEGVKTASVLTAYAKMSEKLGEMVGKLNENEAGLEARKESLNTWKEGKLEVIQSSTKEVQHRVSMVNLEIRKRMDMIIDAAQHEPDVVHVDEDPLMEELEQLMSNCPTPSGDNGPWLNSKTLILGEEASPSPQPQDAQTQRSLPTTPESKTKADETMGDGELKVEQTEPDGGAPKQVEMTQPTPEETALKHINGMEDGPMKSALLALCEASVSKVGERNDAGCMIPL